jgi:glycosyltransferase involved in cell wall biosynthesis
MNEPATTRPIRVTFVLTHPVQYSAAWFRWIHANCRELDLHVIYASQPTPVQQGVGFDRTFAWDVPTIGGYRSTVVRPARPRDRFDAGHFWGLNVTGIGAAIESSRPDVVVVFGWYSISLIRAIRAARGLRVPVLYYGDTNLQSAPLGWQRSLWVAKTRWLLGRFDGYVSIGTRTSAFFRFFGVPPDRIFSGNHAVENDRFTPAADARRSSARRELRRSLGLPEEGFVVLFAGKLEQKKHPLDVINAMAQMERRPHLAVAGSGPLEQSMREAAHARGVGLTILGFINQTDLPSVQAAADCLVLASDGRETWGLVVNEALASGLPCVISDSAGCAPELGSRATGEVYGAVDPSYRIGQLAQAIESVRTRIESGHDFAPACQDLAARHSFAAATEGIVRACRAMTARVNDPKAAPNDGAGTRVLACCGSMVLFGGNERMTFEVLRFLRIRGATVHCIVNGWANQRIVAAADGIGASWSTGFYFYGFTLRIRSLVLLAQLIYDTLRTSAGLLRDAAAFRPSHILVSDYITVVRNAPALALLRLRGRRILLRLGNAPDAGPRFRWVWKYAVSPFVEVFICNSPFTERELAAHGIPKRKRRLIAHTPPSRAEAATPVERDPGRIIYVGQIIPEKGVAALVDAIGLLRARGHDVNLDIVGMMDGWAPTEYERYRTALRARAEQPDVHGYVRFLGYRDDVPGLFAQAAIHCCPSTTAIREGFGIVVIEAKRAGIPSVVFPSGNLPDLITHKRDGWVCRSETPDALAEGIEYFLEPHNLARGMAAARASSDSFSRDRFESAWTSVVWGPPHDVSTASLHLHDRPV